jgi:glycosyltransferase involved in cell wall biosynthesis
MRVLISTYACEPGTGSEPSVGWHWVRQVSRFHEVWMITWQRNRDAIEKCLATKPLPNVHWVYFDLPRWARLYREGQRNLHVHYYLWQLGVYFVGKRLHRNVKFDLVHHVTLGSFWFPSFLALLPVAFVWGPVGAGLPAPRIFWKEFSLRGKVNEWLRAAALSLVRLVPVRARTEDRACAILAVSSVTARQIRFRNQHKITLFSQVGLDINEFDRLGDSGPNGSASFTLLSVGRLVHWKGFALAIKAFANLHQVVPDSQYWIVGDGPEKRKLTELSISLGLAGCVHFVSSLSRRDYLARLRACDAMVYPSLHEPGAFVIVEAMAAGKPVVCLDLGEPGLQVADGTGIKVPISSPEQVVSDLGAEMTRLARDPDLRIRLGTAARRRVREQFDWDKKGIVMTKLYETLCTKEAAVETQASVKRSVDGFSHAN